MRTWCRVWRGAAVFLGLSSYAPDTVSVFSVKVNAARWKFLHSASFTETLRALESIHPVLTHLIVWAALHMAPEVLPSSDPSLLQPLAHAHTHPLGHSSCLQPCGLLLSRAASVCQLPFNLLAFYSFSFCPNLTSSFSCPSSLKVLWKFKPK